MFKDLTLSITTNQKRPPTENHISILKILQFKYKYDESSGYSVNCNLTSQI